MKIEYTALENDRDKKLKDILKKDYTSPVNY